MKDAERVQERLARIGRATADIAAPPGLDARVLAAIAARERTSSRWDVAEVWSSSRQAVVVSLCACAASVALALHLDATLVSTLGSAAVEEADLIAGEP